MKKCIICLIFLTGIVNYLYSFDQSKVKIERGNFYFLVGTEGNERAVMYLHILGTNAYGSYYTESQYIGMSYNGSYIGGFYGSFNGKNLKLDYSYYDYTDNKIEGSITGTLSSDIVFKGKHNSKNVNLSLANTTVNTMKIFSYDYNNERCSASYTIIMYPQDYNERSERKLINDYNSAVEWTDDIDWFDYGESQSIVYIDDRIIIIYYSEGGYYGGAGMTGYNGYSAYTINSKFENSISLTDFIANPKDKRLLSLIKKKFDENVKSDIDFSDSFYDDIEDYGFRFYISPNGTITITMHIDVWAYGLPIREATFTFDEIKPFIKKGSVLEYLFN